MSLSKYLDGTESMPGDWYELVACGKCPLSNEYAVNTTHIPNFVASVMIWFHKRKVHKNG